MYKGSGDISFVELGKLKYEKFEMTMDFLKSLSELDRFSLYMKHIATIDTYQLIENLIEADGKGGFLDMVNQVLTKVSNDEKMRDMANSRAAFLFDQYFREKNARDEGYDTGYNEGHSSGYSEGHSSGYSEGHTSGYSSGHDEALITTAERMMRRGMTGNTIVDITGLDKTTVDNIAHKACVSVMWDYEE